MYTSIALPLFVLPSLLAPVFGIPIDLRPGSSDTQRLITKENTLNATTWNGKHFQPAAKNLTTTVTLYETTTSEQRPSRTVSFIYTPTIINAPRPAKANSTLHSHWNNTTLASNSTSHASSNATSIHSSNGTIPNASLHATLPKASGTNATHSKTSSDAKHSKGDAQQSIASFATTTNTAALAKTFNTTIYLRDLDSTKPASLAANENPQNIDYTITRDNTFTDIQGALHRFSAARVASNGTIIEEGAVATGVDGSVSKGVFTLELVNKMPSENVMAYISGLDPNGALVMLGQDGQWVYPSTDSATPQPVQGNIRIPMGKSNTTTPVALPGFVSSARVWIADGNLDFYVVATPNGPGLVEPSTANSKDPNAAVNYSFAEFSWAADYGIYVNVSYVDFVGLPLGMELSDYNGNTTHSVLGVPSNAAEVLCDQLKEQSTKDGQPWDQLCAYDGTGKVRRVIAPPNLIAQNATAFEGYFSKYVDDVWSWYSSNNLTIDTQSGPGNVTCSVQGDELQCEGDNRGYAKPNSQDIFGCNNGPFAIESTDNAIHLAVVPRLCAAFNRATFMVSGGNVQPGVAPSAYYPTDVAKNFYSDLIKKMEVGGKGYAFSYDDVAPAGEDQSGLLASTSPRVLKLIVGGS